MIRCCTSLSAPLTCRSPVIFLRLDLSSTGNQRLYEMHFMHCSKLIFQTYLPGSHPVGIPKNLVRREHSELTPSLEQVENLCDGQRMKNRKHCMYGQRFMHWVRKQQNVRFFNPYFLLRFKNELGSI
jgi:hypothetical protein